MTDFQNTDLGIFITTCYSTTMNLEGPKTAAIV